MPVRSLAPCDKDCDAKNGSNVSTRQAPADPTNGRVAYEPF